MTADFNHEWIVSDIGGTYARFNRWCAQSGSSDNPSARYRNDDFRDLAALINLCGDGLALFDAEARGADEAAQPADVAARVQPGESAARRAASVFAHALGEFAGDSCLAFEATGACIAPVYDATVKNDEIACVES